VNAHGSFFGKLKKIKMDYEIITSTQGINFSEVSEILKFHGLCDYDADTQKTIFERSYAVVFLLKDGKIIGLGRALSDGVSQAAIYNIALREEYRGRGLGKVVVDELLKQVDGCNVILYTHPKHFGLYEHWGFAKSKTAYVRFQNEEHYREDGFI